MTSTQIARPRSSFKSIDAQIQAEADAHPIGGLPFVYSPGDGTGRDFWRVAKTGDHTLDMILGEALGRKAVAYTRQYERDGWITLLPWTAAAMAKRGEFGSLEFGFMGAVAQAVSGRA